jgi:tetratricopeptide (TPR) repeat protein
MAENFAQLAQQAVATRAITPETLRQSVALLKGAVRLDPNEVRFARLLAEAALQAGDEATAIDAYQAINRLERGNNAVAQIRLLDLYSGRMETADARLRYLIGDADQHKGVYGSTSVASEVRAHAAFLASQVYFERAQTSEGMRMIEEALRLFPLSPEALKAKYELTGGGGATPRERVALLLQMLNSNPCQPGVMARVAQELADVGMHEQALNWYNVAVTLTRAVGRGITPQDLDRLAAQLVITGGTPLAREIAAANLQQNARNVDAAMINVLIARRGGDEEALKKALGDAEQALILRAVNVGQQMRGEPVTTQPSDQPVNVDVPGDIKRLQESGDANLTAEYASTLADLAWLRVYFQQNGQGAAQVIAQLRQLLPADSVTLARLEGWAFLVAGQAQEAQSKLSAVADRDPLAQLGMIRLTEKDNPERATEEARKLMDDNPSGLLGAIIHDALRDKRLKLPAGQQPPLSPAGHEVKAELDRFPKDWLDFIQQPDKFYLIRCEPVKVEHLYGEPVVARVIVKNTGNHDITVGPDGAIRPDLWFDVQVRGALNDFVQGVTFDRFSQQVVLRPGQAMEQTVRVDQDRLLQLLNARASLTLPLFYFVVTNPLSTSISIAPGPGGQRQSFFRTVHRVGLAVDHKAFNNTVMATLGELNNGTADRKLRALQKLGWFAIIFPQMPEEADRAKSAEVLGHMHKLTNDPNPVVRAWAGYVMARLSVVTAEQRQAVIKEMLEDPSWEARMLGTLLVQGMDPAQWKTVAGPLAEGDPDPLVREIADAVIDFADNPAATQPATTQPAEGGAADTVTSGQP